MFDIPILFLTYNKVDTTKKVFDTILKINPKNLIISSDGGKNTVENKDILELRNYFNKSLKSVSFEKFYNKNNLGCKLNVTNSIDKAFEKYDKLIILEDDTLPSKEFFVYTKNLLEIYENYDKVNMISGYNYLTKSKISEKFFFSNYTNIWGWATWKNQWEKRIELNKKSLNDFKKFNMNDIFHSEFEKKYFMQRFEEVVYDNLDSWGYGLVFSNFYQKKFSIYPKYNLVKNIGLGHKNATHTNNFYKYLISTPNIRLNKFQSKNYKFVEPHIDLNIEDKFYRKIIKKNTTYNKVVYHILKRLNKT